MTATRERRCEAKVEAECIHHGWIVSGYLPEYNRAKANLDDLNSRVQTVAGRTGYQRIEREREQAILEVNASTEGLKLLRAQAESDREGTSIFRFHTEEQISKALSHRENLLTEKAISDYTQDGHQNVRRLFDQTGASYYPREDGTADIVFYFQGKKGRPTWFSGNPTDADFDERVLAFRRQIGAYNARQRLFNRPQVRDDIRNSNLSITAPVENSPYVTIKDTTRGYEIAQVFWGEDGKTFAEAKVAHASGNGSLDTLSTAAAFRAFLAMAKKEESPVLPLPNYIAREPVAEPEMPSFYMRNQTPEQRIAFADSILSRGRNRQAAEQANSDALF